MSHELNASIGEAGLTVTARKYLNGVFVGTAISCSEVSGQGGFYSGDMVGAAGFYDIQFFAGGVVRAAGTLNWDGAAEVVGAGNVIIQNHITVPPAVAANSQDPAVLTIVGFCSFSDTMLLGDITGYTDIVFSMKKELTDLDSAALITISKVNGLLTAGGSPASNASYAELIVNDVPTGSVTVSISPSISGLLEMTDGRHDRRYWGTKVKFPTLETEPASGRAVVTRSATMGV